MYTDLITKLKNAEKSGKRSLKIRYSRVDKAIIDVLERFKFIIGSEVKGRPSKRFIFINLKSARPISGTYFHSRPSARKYLGFKDLKRVKGGYGISVISTSKGIMAGHEAYRQKVGGEILFEIW